MWILYPLSHQGSPNILTFSNFAVGPHLRMIPKSPSLCCPQSLLASYSHQRCVISTIKIHLLQVLKLRRGEVKELAEGHTATEWWGQDSGSGGLMLFMVTEYKTGARCEDIHSYMKKTKAQVHFVLSSAFALLRSLECGAWRKVPEAELYISPSSCLWESRREGLPP